MNIKYAGKIWECYLIDDGTLDTVISVDGHVDRYDTEYASQFRNNKGDLTIPGFRKLCKETIDTFSGFED